MRGEKEEEDGGIRETRKTRDTGTSLTAMAFSGKLRRLFSRSETHNAKIRPVTSFLSLKNDFFF